MPNLRALNPFASLPNARAVGAWGMYDAANQSFQLLINTLLFGVYMEQVVGPTPADGQRAWTRMVAGALLGVVVLSPVLGAVADARAWKREILLASGLICSALTAGLALVGPGDVWFAAVLYVAARIACGIGENFLGSFLPELAAPERMGRVSAIGWSMSYVGAIALQLSVLLAVKVFGLADPSRWPPLFVFAGLWFLAGMVPAVFLLRERARPQVGGASVLGVVGAGAARLAGTVRHAARYRHLLVFLGVFFVYSMGTQTVIYLSSNIALDVGFDTGERFALVLVLAVTAGLAAVGAGRFQDRLGSRRTIRAFLLVWVASTLGLAVMVLVGAPKVTLWVLSIGLGVGLGGIGTASRAMVGLLTPASKSAEFFGLWGLVYNLSGVVGVSAFGEVYAGAGRTIGLFLLAGFFGAGLLLLRFVDERAGAAAAARDGAPAPPTPPGPGATNLPIMPPATPTSLSAVPDSRGRFGAFGGSYVPETLVAALEQLKAEYERARQDRAFWDELGGALRMFVGRPTPLYRADRLTAHARSAAAPGHGATIWLKREDLAHTGAHKINNTLGQGLLTRRMGKARVIAETGAGQHGVATATAAAVLGLRCDVYMGAEDARRQRLNVIRMRILGARVVEVNAGSRTLKDATNEAMRDWMGSVEHTHYIIGSVVGPHPFPMIVRDFQSVIGREARAQALAQFGRLPDCIVACVGGGSNAAGIFHPFIDDAGVRLVGVEAGGRSSSPGDHAASLGLGSPGILHGSLSYVLQDPFGQTADVHSCSAGLDYPGVGPEHAYWKDSGRVAYTSVTDDEALDAFTLLARLEGIIPALESAHAIAEGARLAAAMRADQHLVINLSGRGDKDVEEAARLLDLKAARPSS